MRDMTLPVVTVFGQGEARERELDGELQETLPVAAAWAEYESLDEARNGTDYADLTRPQMGVGIYTRDGPLTTLVEGAGSALLNTDDHVMVDFPGSYRPDRMWGLGYPQEPLTAWRGMQIADRLDRYGRGDLAACYHAAQRDPHPRDREQYVDSIAERISADEREQILAIAPAAIDDVLTTLDDRGVPYHRREILEEAERGIVPETPRVQEIQAEYEEWRAEHDPDEAGRIPWIFADE